MGVATSHAYLYTTVSPCWDCAKAIISTGIKRVVYREWYRLIEPIDLLNQAGVYVCSIDQNGNVNRAG